MFDGEILAPSACFKPPSGGEIFLKLFEDVLPSAGFFLIVVGISNSLTVSDGRSSFKLPWVRLMISDGKNSSTEWVEWMKFCNLK
jgi:hypothetical protein